MLELPVGVFPPVLLAAPLLLLEPKPAVVLRLPEVERGTTLRRPAQVELVNHTSFGMMLSVDDQIALVTTRAATRWTLDPARWLAGSSSKVVLLRVSLLRNGRFQLVQ